jgi:hypothetical protein
MSFNRGLLLNLYVCTVLAGALSAALCGTPAMAQISGGRGGHGGEDQAAKDEAKKKKRDEEFGKAVAPLPALRNAGPCPFVKVLYDAARYVEFKDNREASSAVGYTGEIENITSACAYKLDQPIRVSAQVLFELGRGPDATGRGKTYRYWVAVTDRNHAVIDKREFEMPVSFPAGQDRVSQVEKLDGIVIPRKDAKVSGANFEVLIGFDVTPQMAAFNRDGKRFRPNASGQVAAARP